MTKTVPTLVFADTETTSLRHDRRVWEIGAIVRPAGGTRADDVEHQWFIDTGDLDLGNADPASLKIGRFYERHPQMNGTPLADGGVYTGEITAGVIRDNQTGILSLPTRPPIRREWMALASFEKLTRFAWIVGAVPWFDTEVLGARMRANNTCPAWHYHLIDVENLAAGALAEPPPWGFDDLLQSFALTYDEADRHTALGDARMVRDLYDRVITHRRIYIDADAGQLAAQLGHPATLKLVPPPPPLGGDDAPAS